jgi:hypothetical protein
MNKLTWVYRRTEFSPYCLYTVGFYTPEGKWEPESDYNDSEKAAARVHYLNGGSENTREPLTPASWQ